MTTGSSRGLRLRRGILAVGSALILGFAVSAAVDLGRSYRQTLVDIESGLGNVSRALAEQAVDVFSSTDYVLRALISWHKGEGRQASIERKRAVLEFMKTGVPFNGLFVSDAQGELLYSSESVPSGIRAQETGAVAAVDGRYSVLISRELLAEDGRVEARVGALVDLGEFQKLYEAIDPGLGNRILLLRNDGLILARQANKPDVFGTHFNRLDEILSAKAARRVGATLPATRPGGAARFYALAPVPGYPFLVMTTRDETVALGAWSAMAVHTGVRTVLLLLLGALLMAVLVRQLARADAREQTLREHAALLDLTRDMVFVRDANGVVTYWNRGAEEAYRWGRSEAIGHRAHELLKTDFPAPVADISAELERTGYWEGELVHRRRDGTVIIVASRWALQRGEHGRPGSVLETNNDITARRLAERARQDIEEQWQAAFASNPTMYFIVDAAGKIVTVNTFGAEQLGYDANELIGQPVLNVFYEEDREPVQKNAESCFENLGRKMRWEARKIRKDGTMLWVRETANAVLLKKRPVLLIVCEDITEQKRAEEALRASEERFRTLMQFSFDVYWESDAEHRFIRQEFAETFAEVPAPGSEIGKTPWEVPYLEPDEEAWRAHRVTLDAHLPFRDFELARPTPDGGKRYVSVSGLPVFDQAGGFIGYRGVGRSITERKRAEQALRQSEKELRDVVETIPAMAWTILPDGSGVFVSRGWTEYTGLSVEATDDFGWRAAVHPDDLGVYVETWRAAVAGRVPVESETRFRRAGDGAYRWFLVRAVPLCDEKGNVVKWYGIATDIEARKRTEQALRRSEGYLSEAQRLTHTGSWAYDPASGRNSYWSDELLRIHQRTDVPDPEEYVSQLVHPDDRNGFREAWERALREKAEFACDYRIVLPDGAIKHIRGIGHPVFDATGEFVEYVGTVADVTERKRAEEEHAAHLWFLGSMDRINLAMQGTSDLEQMLSDVLDAALEIFACDRAWLIHPCAPEAASWRAVMEHTQPQFPGAFALGADQPIDVETAALFSAARASSGALSFGSGNEHPLPGQLAERFSIRSQLAMAVYPRVDQPYLFGLHECSRPRVWTAQERRLFEEIGQRLAGALTGLLMLRSLRESERKLEEAQRIAHVGYWDVDPESRQVTFSDEACRIHGLQPHELASWQGRFQELVQPEDRARVMQAATAALQGGPRLDVEYRVLRPNGGVRIVHSRGDVMLHESGRPRRVFGIVQDITELRQAEEGLRASEARFRTFVDHATDAFFLHGDDGTVLDVNRQACESLGYGRDELIGVNPMDFDPDLDEAHLRQNLERLNAGEILTLETHHRRKDGRVFPVEIRLRSFLQGDRRFIVALAQDITQRKEAEAAKARLEAELRRSQKMEAVGTLAGGIAHDFNNILGAILGYGELAQRKVHEGIVIEDELDQVMQAGHRGKRLVEHILAFSRSGSSSRVAVHVQSVVEETLALLAASLPEGVRLEQRLAAGDAAVVGDATQLHQVAMNLCTNAVQAMAAGGVLSVTLEREEVVEQRALSHGVLEPGAYVRLAVSDTGTGIPRTALERIFDPFFTTKGVGKGTGLGLSLVHGIVTDYHGVIDVATREGEGTTFTVWLPYSGEAEAPPGEDMAELPQGSGESVMIVDDERPLVRLAEETLAQLGYDPAGFESSVAALEAFRAEPQRYDVVLTDQTMPELTGTELAQEIRRLRPEVPIVLMSGYKGPQLTELAQAAGVREILHKPLISRDIAEALARALPHAPD